MVQQPDGPPAEAVARGGIALVLRFVVISALNYVFGVVLAWLLVPEEFGRVSILQTILWLGAMVLNSGFPWTLAWSMARRGQPQDAIDRVFRSSLCGNAAFGVFLSAILLVLHLSGGLGLGAEVTTMMLLVALTLPFISLNSVARGAMHGASRFGHLGLVQAGEVLIKVVVGLFLVLLTHLGATAVALAFLVGAVAATGANAWLLRGSLPGRGPMAGFSTFSSTVSMFIGAIGFALLVSLDVLSLRALGAAAGVTAATVGFYQVGVILARSLYFVGDALVDAVFPGMVRRQESAVHSHGYLATALRWIGLVVVPLEIVLALSPGPIVGLFFPARYAEAVPLVRLLAVGSVGALATTLFGKGLQALDRRRTAALGVTTGLAIEVVLLFGLVPRVGAIGAALSFTAGSWAATAVLAWIYFRHQQVLFPSPWRALRYAGALALLAVSLLPAVLRPERSSWLLVAVGLSAYAVALLATRLMEVGELRRLASIARRMLPSAQRLLSPAQKVFVRGLAALGEKLWLLVAAAVLLAFLVTVWNVANSPDTLYDEVVYTRAAQSVASTGQLTWTGSPLFIHPPLYFLTQAAWLRLTGAAHAPLFEAIHNARLLSAGFTALGVGLTAALAFSLSAGVAPLRRAAVAGAAALLMTFDPILLRFGRLGMIESLAIALSLLTVYVSWSTRRASPRIWIPVVGLLSGVALLVKEVTVVLLVIPVLFSALSANWRMAGRSVAALGIGVAFWLLFPAWAGILGLWPRFLEEKLLTVERLLGLLQLTGWNRPTVSFLEALRLSAFQYGPSYLLLLAGGLVLVWLWLTRTGERTSFLIAWLGATYAFGAFTVVRGQLNEQFFTYLIPGATVATVLWVDHFVTAQRGRHRSAPPSRWRIRVPVFGLAAVALLSGFNWYRLDAAGSDHGIEQMVAWVGRSVDPCATLNASGDLQKYVFTLEGHRITNFGSGPLALSRGVRYFFLNKKDVFARYGRMTPDFAAWIRRNGTRVAAFPSHTHWGVGLWRVDASPFSPVADLQPIQQGLFVNVRGSACGGYPVVNGTDGLFFDSYQRLGGKPVLGRPLSVSWVDGGMASQAFDTVLLAAPLDIAPKIAPSPIKLVPLLARDHPSALAAHNLPVPDSLHTPGDPQDLLSDPVILRAYLHVAHPETARPREWASARQRWGDPLGPPEVMADGAVRQPFERVIFERGIERSARLAPLGRAAVTAGVVPDHARRFQPVPNLEVPAFVRRPSHVWPFVRLFGSGLALWVVLSGLSMVIAARSSRRAVPREVPTGKDDGVIRRSVPVGLATSEVEP
jgi:O-antigen/teichoic acid export membrane protein